MFNLDGTVTVDGLTMTYNDHKEVSYRQKSSVRVSGINGIHSPTPSGTDSKHKKSAEPDYSGFA